MTRTSTGPKRPAIGALDRTLLEGEGGVGHGLVEHLGLGEGAELEILRGDVALGGDGLEGGAFLDLGGGSLGFGLGREGDLLDRAALGRAELRLLLLVALAGIGLGHGIGLGESGGIERHDRRRPGIRERGRCSCAR